MTKHKKAEKTSEAPVARNTRLQLEANIPPMAWERRHENFVCNLSIYDLPSENSAHVGRRKLTRYPKNAPLGKGGFEKGGLLRTWYYLEDSCSHINADHRGQGKVQEPGLPGVCVNLHAVPWNCY